MICLPIVIRKNKNLFLVFKIIFILGIIGGIIGAIIGDKIGKINNIYTQISIFSFLIICVIWVFLSIAIKRYTIFGKIIISEDSIDIEYNDGNTKQFLFRKIKNIKINISGYDGDVIDNIIVPSAISKDGIDNYIEFEFNNSKIKYEFFIKDDIVLKVFLRRIKEFKENQIQIKLENDN